MIYAAEKWFGISTGAFILIVGFWALIFVMLFGEDRLAGIATCFMTLITALLLSMFGPWLFTVFILFLVGVFVYFIARKPTNSGSTASSFTSNQNRADNRASMFSNSNCVNTAPSKLYHGTPRLNAAIDIATQNRWLLKNDNREGIYMAEDFKTAAVYASRKGAVVEIAVTIPPGCVINLLDMRGDSDWVLDSGFRLIRNANIYIAPIPKSASNNEYFRVEGLRPVGLLDPKGNPIPINKFS
jgi:hypothetical protein